MSSLKFAKSSGVRGGAQQFGIKTQTKRDFPSWHFSMLNDQQRNRAIERAIADLQLAGKTVVEIDTGTFLRVTSTATFETLQDHDLTLSERDKASGGKSIIISGATEAEFNGTFVLLRVINTAQVSLLCESDDEKVMTYVSRPLDVSLVCEDAAGDDDVGDRQTRID